jgi:pimeloyl-ACP methyl ester carboxylesterase
MIRYLLLASLGLLGCLLVVIALSTTYQVTATTRERTRFSNPGRLVDVGGYRLHLRCDGFGSPTVVFESGFGMTSNAWALVQPEVAKFTRVCSYDRTGYGWSEGGPDADPVGVLHVLLRNGSVFEPYVMVGHSYGCEVVRRYAFRFPDEVAGIVLAATSYPDEETLKYAKMDEHERRFFQLYGWSVRTGLLRMIPERFLPEMLRVYTGLLRKYLPPNAAESEVTFLRQTRHVQSLVSEAAHPNLGEEMEDVAGCHRGLGNMPLIVLAEKWVYSPTPTEQEKEEARREDARQARLASLSSRGKKIDVDAGHLIPLERPAVVIDAIRDVVLTAREMR